MVKHKHADVIIAWANGAIIEFKSSPKDNWCYIHNPSFCVNTQYRVKPSDEYIPFDYSDAEVLLGQTVKAKDDSEYRLIYVCSTSYCSGYNYNYMFEHYTFLDGTPFGKLNK